MKNSHLRTLRPQFLGAMILILVGVGVGAVAQVLTSPDDGLGAHGSIAWASAVGATLGVHVAARLAGARLNPAVAIVPAAFTGSPWRTVPSDLLAQSAGAFVVAVIFRFRGHGLPTSSSTRRCRRPRPSRPSAHPIGPGPEVRHSAGTERPGERARVDAASRVERVVRKPAGTQETRP